MRALRFGCLLAAVVAFWALAAGDVRAQSDEELKAANRLLLPLIAHDRAGFGGGVLTIGVMLLVIAWCATPSRAVWQAP